LRFAAGFSLIAFVIFTVYIGIAMGAYLLGSIPTGFLAGKARGIDIRQTGSGNIGATNAFRILGKKAGLLVLLGDALKGFLACRLLPRLAVALSGSAAAPVDAESLAVLAGLFAILGHMFTLWLNFKGGKGIATTAGVLAALAPVSCLITVGLWLATLVGSRYVSVASMAAAIGLPFIVWAAGGNAALIALVCAVSLLALYKHRTNFQRLLRGTENRFCWSKRSSSTKAKT